MSFGILALIHLLNRARRKRGLPTLWQVWRWAYLRWDVEGLNKEQDRIWAAYVHDWISLESYLRKEEKLDESLNKALAQYEPVRELHEAYLDKTCRKYESLRQQATMAREDLNEIMPKASESSSLYSPASSAPSGTRSSPQRVSPSRLCNPNMSMRKMRHQMMRRWKG